MISFPFISLILDSIISNYILLSTNFFLPLFTLTSLVIIYPFINNDRKYLKILIIVGLLYDGLTNTLFIQTILFIILMSFVKYVTSYLNSNLLNSLITLILTIILYRVMYYLILVMSNNYQFDINVLFKSIYASFILNIIYGIISYAILLKFKKKYYH